MSLESSRRLSDSRRRRTLSRSVSPSFLNAFDGGDSSDDEAAAKAAAAAANAPPPVPKHLRKNLQPLPLRVFTLSRLQEGPLTPSYDPNDERFVMLREVDPQTGLTKWVRHKLERMPAKDSKPAQRCTFGLPRIRSASRRGRQAGGPASSAAPEAAPKPKSSPRTSPRHATSITPAPARNAHFLPPIGASAVQGPPPPAAPPVSTPDVPTNAQGYAMPRSLRRDSKWARRSIDVRVTNGRSALGLSVRISPPSGDIIAGLDVGKALGDAVFTKRSSIVKRPWQQLQLSREDMLDGAGGAVAAAADRKLLSADTLSSSSPLSPLSNKKKQLRIAQASEHDDDNDGASDDQAWGASSLRRTRREARDGCKGCTHGDCRHCGEVARLVAEFEATQKRREERLLQQLQMEEMYSMHHHNHRRH